MIKKIKLQNYTSFLFCWITEIIRKSDIKHIHRNNNPMLHVLIKNAIQKWISTDYVEIRFCLAKGMVSLSIFLDRFILI